MNTDQELWHKLYDEDEYEYVSFIALRYYGDYDIPMCIPAELPPLEDLAYISMGEEEAPSLLGIGQDGFVIFRDIETGKKEFRFGEDDYYRNEDIQLTLRLIGLDPQKFWHALLYIHSMAEKNNTDCFSLLPSIHERIEDLYSALEEDGTIVTIKRQGKAPFVIDDSETKEFVAYFLRYGDEKYAGLNNPTYVGRSYNMSAGLRDVGLQWQIYEEYVAFKLLFDKYCTDKDLPARVAGQEGSRSKDLLVSRILYMTRLVDDERYLTSVDPIHSIKDKCLHGARPKSSSGLF